MVERARRWNRLEQREARQPLCALNRVSQRISDRRDDVHDGAGASGAAAFDPRSHEESGYRQCLIPDDVTVGERSVFTKRFTMVTHNDEQCGFR